MKVPIDFQTISLKLQSFWAEKGCLIWQPYYTQVGAGTMNPGTYLRVLGPEPWNVAYIEPSIRPDDGRYGENPNRMQMHYQFQVILKPDPGNPQDLYLESLQALGIDPGKIRQLSTAGFLVKPFGVTLLADLQRCTDINLAEFTFSEHVTRHLPFTFKR